MVLSAILLRLCQRSLHDAQRFLVVCEDLHLHELLEGLEQRVQDVHLGLGLALCLRPDVLDACEAEDLLAFVADAEPGAAGSGHEGDFHRAALAGDGEGDGVGLVARVLPRAVAPPYPDDVELLC